MPHHRKSILIAYPERHSTPDPVGTRAFIIGALFLAAILAFVWAVF